MSASYWPDMIRDRKHPMHDRHRGPWHYVNYPHAPDGDNREVPMPVEHWEPGQEPANVIQAIKWSRHQLVDPELSDTEKAIALCWYLHLVGDIHQPLHAVALVTEEFPKGDRGGNLIQITYRGGGGQNLHAWWDQRLGGYLSGPSLDRVAERTLEENPVEVLGDQVQVASPEQYARESLELATLWVYVDSATTTAAEAELPPGYAVVSAAIARRRVAQAGLRMAAELPDLCKRARP